VAAKAAENIARLAALFHLLDHGAASTIDRTCVDSAAQIVGWHLQEAHRLLGDLDAPPVMAAAIRFNALLAEHGRARIEEEGRRRFMVVNPAPYRD
jgi:putative DNA primase/helicase